MGTVEPQEPIRLFSLLGVTEENRHEWTVRLNSARYDKDLLSEYYLDRDRLTRHISQARWTKEGRRYLMSTPKVLQFIQQDDDDKTRWVFVGGYEVGKTWEDEEGHLYQEVSEIAALAPYAVRLVGMVKRKQGYTNWNYNLNTPAHWHHFSQELVVEKLGQSQISSKPFPGFENIFLTPKELRAVLRDESWSSPLNSINAVYLITDVRTGWHYVGSAYGFKGASKGLRARWEAYAENGHGGNKRLKELVRRHEIGYIEEHFRYTILEVFDRKTSRNEIINREHWWMDVLSSVYRASDASPHGYNSIAERETTTLESGGGPG